MKKKIVALLLAAVSVISTAACTKQESDSGITEIKVFMPGTDQAGWPDVLAEVNKITEEKIGVKVDMQIIDTGAYSQRMKMNMSSGADFDICFTGYVNGYIAAAKSGGLMDITELLDKHDMKGILPEEIWDAATYKGKIFGVPNYQIVATANSIVVFDELASKYDFDWSQVKHIDDIEPYLAMVKEAEPDIYPYRPYYGNLMWTLDYEEVASMIALPKGSTSADDLVYIYDTPEYNHGINQLHNWYKKGYIRRDALSAGDDSLDYKSGKYAISNTVWKPGADVQEKIVTGKDVTIIPLEDPYMTRGKCLATMLSIGASAKHPDEALEFIKLVNTDPELYNLFVFGIEGKNYVKENGIVKMIEGSGYDNSKFAWMFGNQFNAYIMEGQDMDVWEQTEKVNDEAQKSTLVGFEFDPANVRTEVSNVATIQGEYQVANKGARAPEEYMEEYKRRLKDAGLEKIYDEVKRQLTEYFASK